MTESKGYTNSKSRLIEILGDAFFETVKKVFFLIIEDTSYDIKICLGRRGHSLFAALYGLFIDEVKPFGLIINDEAIPFHAAMLKPGARVLIVDDVINHGVSIRKCVNKLINDYNMLAEDISVIAVLANEELKLKKESVDVYAEGGKLAFREEKRFVQIRLLEENKDDESSVGARFCSERVIKTISKNFVTAISVLSYPYALNVPAFLLEKFELDESLLSCVPIPVVEFEKFGVDAYVYRMDKDKFNDCHDAAYMRIYVNKATQKTLVYSYVAFKPLKPGLLVDDADTETRLLRYLSWYLETMRFLGTQGLDLSKIEPMSCCGLFGIDDVASLPINGFVKRVNVLIPGLLSDFADIDLSTVELVNEYRARLAKLIAGRYEIVSCQEDGTNIQKTSDIFAESIRVCNGFSKESFGQALWDMRDLVDDKEKNSEDFVADVN